MALMSAPRRGVASQAFAVLPALQLFVSKLSTFWTPQKSPNSAVGISSFF